MKHLYLAFLLFGIVCHSAQAQEAFRNFTTLTYNQSLQENSVAPSSGKSAISLIEQQTAQTIRFSSDFTEKTIPVVFHILHGDATQKVSEENIERQLAALNNHFSLSEKIENHPNDPDGIYAKRAVDTKIRFCLATTDGAGNAISGINYVPTSVTEWKELVDIKGSQEGVTAITPENLLNIWVAALPVENVGYAQMPGRGTMATDGVVINHHYFGLTSNENYGQGASLTFLIGQYLNLYPLSGHSQSYPCSDDYVDDTPLHNSRNSGCPSNLHVSICTKKYVPEMLMNFMSANTGDACKYMFTRGQAARMQAVLDSTGFRHDLALAESICSENGLAEAADRNTNLTTKEFGDSANLSIYPNPANSNITVELTNIAASSYTIEVLTTEGRMVLSQAGNATANKIQATLNINDLSTGFYLVKVHTNETTLVQKLTIE